MFPTNWIDWLCLCGYTIVVFPMGAYLTAQLVAAGILKGRYLYQRTYHHGGCNGD